MGWNRVTSQDPSFTGEGIPTDIIFDFFGTLVGYRAGAFHTAPYHRSHDFLVRSGFPVEYDAFERTFDAVSQEMEDEARLTFQEYHMSDTTRRFFLAAFDSHAPVEVVDGFITHFLADWSRGIVHFTEIGRFLETLRSDYRLSILSNTHFAPLIHDNLASMGIEHYFSRVFTSIEVGMRKPHPAIFEHAVRDLQIEASSAVYVGDTLIDDYEGASGAGIPCVLIDPDGQHPGVPTRIKSLFDLSDYLSEMRAFGHAGPSTSSPSHPEATYA